MTALGSWKANTLYQTNKCPHVCMCMYACVCGYDPLLVNQNGFNISGAVLSGIDL